MRAVGYIRVSRVGGRGGDSFLSPELQREQIAAVARRESLKVTEIIEELDASGGNRARPGWNRAIEMVERGEVGGIAVWNLSRFSRSVKDALDAQIIPKAHNSGRSLDESHAARRTPGWQLPQTDQPAESHSTLVRPGLR